MDLYQITPRWRDRAFLCGMTGSGKTTLAQMLLQQHYSKGRYIVVYDAKGEIKWPGYVKYTRLAAAQRSKARAILYQPRWEEIKPDYQNEFFKWIYLRKNTLVYVDEVYAVGNSYRFPEYYRAIATRGRERGISLYSSTQRPKDIPMFIVSEAEYAYIFSLGLLGDRKRVSECYPTLGAWEVEELQKDSFQFFFYNKNNNSKFGPTALRME